MDPLSIIASTITIVGLVDKVVRKVRKIARLKHVVSLLQQLDYELSDLRLVVRKVEDICWQALTQNSDSVSDQEILSKAIDRAKNAILELEKVIEYGLLAPAEGTTIKINRLFWIRKESEVRDSRDRLRDAKWGLSIAIGLDQMQSQTTTQLRLVQLQASGQLITSRQQMLEEIIDSKLPQLERPALQPGRASDQHEHHFQQHTAPPLELSIEADLFPDQAIVVRTTRPPTPEPVLRILRICPSDSEIFKALRNRDISRIRRMIMDGKASVRDVNEEGESLITIALTLSISYDSSYFTELTHLGADIFQVDNRSLSAYLYFWRAALINSQSRPKDQLDIFGSELDLEHFQFTPLHAAVLDLSPDGAKPIEAICATPRQLINDLDQLGRNALSWACAKGNLCKVEKLLKMGADPNIADSEGRTSLHHMASAHSLAHGAVSASELCLDVLLDHGADVNVRNNRGGTPLHDFTICSLCLASSVEKFYLKGADLNAQDSGGWTPLHWAVRNGNIELIDKLVHHGADLKLQSYIGVTSLTYALIRHQFGTFKYLLELDCDYKVRTRSGSTLLHLSARDGDIDTLRLLEQRDLEGIEPDDRDEDELTALERAERRRDGVYEWVDFVSHEVLPDADPQKWFEAFFSLNQKLKTTQAEV